MRRLTVAAQYVAPGDRANLRGDDWITVWQVTMTPGGDVKLAGPRWTHRLKPWELVDIERPEPIQPPERADLNM